MQPSVACCQQLKAENRFLTKVCAEERLKVEFIQMAMVINLLGRLVVLSGKPDSTTMTLFAALVVVSFPRNA